MNPNNENTEIETDVESEDDKNIVSTESKPEKKISRKRLILTGTLVMILSMGTAAGYVFGIDPLLKEHEASKTLSEFSEKRGPLTASNTETVSFTPEGDVSSNNGEQKALTGDYESSDSAAFVFTNGKQGDKKQVDLYLDFGSQRSRDFLALNQTNLKLMIETGQIDLYIHPVPTQEAISIYASETIAETFATAPEKAWSVMIEMIKISASIDSSPVDESKDEILTMIASATNSVGASSVTAETIQSGTFASWILTVGDDSKVKNQFGLPAIYVDGGLLDQDSVDINDSASLKKYLKN